MRRLSLIWLFAMLCTAVGAQEMLHGTVIDAQTGEGIPYASAAYKGNSLMVAGNDEGRFTIERHNGWALTMSAVGYEDVTLKVDASTPLNVRVELKPTTQHLKEVTVRHKRSRYSRKDNPAVELMRRVIAAKKRTSLENHLFYSYNKYQKLTLAFNDINDKDTTNGMFKKHPWLLEQVETSPYTGKRILPVSVDETVTKHVYRREPKSEKDIIIGETSSGVNELFETGDILTVALKDVFTDVDIYDNNIRLLQYPFTSPIGDGAISFYRYYIVDTVKIDRDSCFHIEFLPNNQQDFGFRGELYIIKDSTLHVKQCTLTLPKKSDVNFVENLRIEQEYTQLSNGEWVLTSDDMIVEMTFAKFINKVLVARATRLSDYDFTEQPANLFRGKARERKEANAMMRDDDFWNKHRGVELTKSESSMDNFLKHIENIKGFKYIIFCLRALVENYVETSSPSKVDIGPVNTMITQNFIDGLRTRVSAQTTANLMPHWFLSGYYAYGWNSKKNYYKGELTYSLNKKEYLPREFPKRTLTFTSTYDVCSPSDKFIHTDKDNVFTSFKWAEVDKMMFYNRQQVQFEYEQEWGFKTTVTLKTEGNEACGNLFFIPLSEDIGGEMPVGDETNLHNGKIRTTELSVQLRIAPGETFINTKQRRIPMNLDTPVFTVGHTMGFNGFMGGRYAYNYSEVNMYKRFWMPHNWGKVDIYLKGGIQWDRVPFPLLIVPAANLSYIIEDESFNMINNMEFLNDRFVSLDASWDINGKIFNRVPLLKRLKWREYIGVKCLWGMLTDKNNPNLERNAGSDYLMYFPTGTYVMDRHKPYVELIAGVHNIFKLLHVQYVYRVNYQELPTARKHGVRLMMRLTF